MSISRKAPDLEAVTKKARARPFRADDTTYRHVVTVFVDTAEANEDRVADAVQQAVDEVTGTIQDDKDVTFDEATVVEVKRTRSRGPDDLARCARVVPRLSRTRRRSRSRRYVPARVRSPEGSWERHHATEAHAVSGVLPGCAQTDLDARR